MKGAEELRLILYNRSEEKSPVSERFLSTEITSVPFDDEKELGKLVEKAVSEGFLSKEVLILDAFKGRRFQKCPGSKGMICCNYYLINTCFGCLYDCAYCFLNFYLNSFGIFQFTNINELSAEVDRALPVKNDGIYRVGTGEYTDSLMFDELTGLCRAFTDQLAHRDDILLEFKTKSGNVDHVLDLPRRDKTVLAWSLNTPDNVEKYEKDTAPLSARLEAAKKASDAGFLLAFHFDPIIEYPGFIEDYFETIDLLYEAVDPDRIVWISLGGLRYTPGFEDIIADRFPDEKMTVSEMFPSPDMKLRYFKHKRIDMYKKMNQKLLEKGGKPFIYLCMERDEIWEASMGRVYHSSSELEEAMSSHIVECFIN